MPRHAGTQRFPAGAELRVGRCTAPLHDPDRDGAGGLEVATVRLRLGIGPAGLEHGYYMCAECLADFAVAGLSGAYVLVKGIDGAWHEVTGTVPES